MTTVTSASGGTGESVPATDAPTATSEPATTAASPGTTAAAGTTERGPSGVDGPPAPDFTLELGDGSVYQLSADTKPVFMIFWAEW